MEIGDKVRLKPVSAWIDDHGIGILPPMRELGGCVAEITDVFIGDGYTSLRVSINSYRFWVDRDWCVDHVRETVNNFYAS